MKEKIVLRENLFSWILSKFNVLENLFLLMMKSKEILGKIVWGYIKQRDIQKFFDWNLQNFVCDVSI